MNSIFRRVSIRKRKLSRKKWNNCFELQWQRRLHATSSREELALPFQSFSQNAKEQEKLKVSLTFPIQPLTINLSFLSNQSYKTY